MLYHGSLVEVKIPEKKYSKPNCDYGQAFYTTEDFSLAAEWAVEKNRDGFINKYKIDKSDFNVLNLDEYTPIHWAATIAQYRFEFSEDELLINSLNYLIKNFAIDVEKFDIIEGNRADDRYYEFVDKFFKGDISVVDLYQAIKLGNWGKQIAIKSDRAYKAIKFVDSEIADHKTWYSINQQRFKNASREFNNIINQRKLNYKKRKEELTIFDICELGVTRETDNLEDILKIPKNLQLKSQRKVRHR